MRIRAMTHHDAPQVLKIYQDGINTGNATFATTTPDWDTFDATHHTTHRYVATEGADILGWAAISPTSTREVYKGVVEDSIYIASHAQRKGAGNALMTTLTRSCDTTGIWTIQAGIFPENTASLALHHAHGFRTTGTSIRIGKLHGRWRDVIRLERRSTTAGTD